MSKSQRILDTDAKALVRLVAEACEATNDPAQRLADIATGSCQLLRARMGSVCWGRQAEQPGKLELLAYIMGGYVTDTDRRMVQELNNGDHGEDLMSRGLGEHMVSLGVEAGAVLREEVVSDEEWYNSAHVSTFRKPGDMDSCIYAGAQAPRPDEFLGMTFHRPWGDRHFRVKERRLVDILQFGITPLYRSYIKSQAKVDPLTELPPRLREVLLCLLRGDSEKQVAHRLGIAAQTVHSHVKRLHRRLGVSSRGELFAWAIAQGIRAG